MVRDLFVPIAIIMTLFFAGFGGIFQTAKILNQGTEYVEGTVIYTKKGAFADCVEVSKTTQGESSVVELCVFDDINLPKIKEYVKITFKRSPYFFLDTMDIK